MDRAPSDAHDRGTQEGEGKMAGNPGHATVICKVGSAIRLSFFPFLVTTATTWHPDGERKTEVQHGANSLTQRLHRNLGCKPVEAQSFGINII